MAEAMEMPVLLPAEEGIEAPAVALDRAICLVGARARVHLPLQSPQVSKSHALIVNDQDRVYIRDLASKNHTFVNDRPVKEAALGQSDEIRIGRYKFRCGPGFTKSPPPVIYETPRAQLQVDGSERIDVAGKTALIGGREGCDVRLKGDEVAPVHAVIFERNGKRFVRDLNSGIGTGVNGVSVHEEQLKDGDELSIGGVTIRYNVLDQAGDEPKTHSNEAMQDGAKPLEISLGDDSDLPIALAGEKSAPPADEKRQAAADAIPLADEDEPDHLPVVGQSFDSSSSLSIKSKDSKAVESKADKRNSDIDSLIPLADEALAPMPEPPQEKPAPSVPVVAEARDQDRLPVEIDSSVEEEELEDIGVLETPTAKSAQTPEASAEPEPKRKIEINMSEADVEEQLAEPEDQKVPEEEPAAQESSETLSTQRITNLVGEIAEKAQELETAWRDFSHGHDGDADGEHPGAISDELQWPSKGHLEEDHSSDREPRKEKSVD